MNRKFLLFSLLWLSLFAWFVHQKISSPTYSKRFAIHEAEPESVPLRQPSTDEGASTQTLPKEK